MLWSLTALVYKLTFSYSVWSTGLNNGRFIHDHCCHTLLAFKVVLLAQKVIGDDIDQVISPPSRQPPQIHDDDDDGDTDDDEYGGNGDDDNDENYDDE